jgi:hypothetical protein
MTEQENRLSIHLCPECSRGRQAVDWLLGGKITLCPQCSRRLRREITELQRQVFAASIHRIHQVLNEYIETHIDSARLIGAYGQAEVGNAARLDGMNVLLRSLERGLREF